MYDQITTAIEQGRNIFITGPAGTGKSYTLDLLKQNYDMIVTASTGAAAVNVGGTTIHSFAGIGLGVKPAKDIVENMYGGTRSRIKECSMLAIDEVSMLDAQTLDLIDTVFRGVRRNDSPFGGVQMVFIGDFLQLPPVQGAFAFLSDSWERAAPEMFHLTKVWRQDDDGFLDILHKARFGVMSDTAALSLRETKLNGHAVNLYAKNAPAEQFNLNELRRIKSRQHIFESIDSGDDRHLKNCITPRSLWIKEGARVMLTINLDIADGLVNGSMGDVISIKDGVIKVAFDNGISRDLGIETVCKVERGNYTLATRQQYPLRLAWAISIHKSQGMTLERVRVDMGGVLEYGQAYVALSRATSLEGLEVRNLSIADVKAHPTAVNFYQRMREKGECHDFK